MKNIFVTTEVAARLERLPLKTIQMRIYRNKYPSWALKKEARESGGYMYEINIEALSTEAQSLYRPPITPLDDAPPQKGEESGVRKRRSDAGTTGTDEEILFRCAAKISVIRVSSSKRIKKNTGALQVYNNLYIPYCDEKKIKTVSYRQFLNLVNPFIDEEVKKKANLGEVRYKNEQQMVLQHDYSVYEPMQFIQSDHSQFDVICIHNNKILRPWAAFHNSIGDRMLNYPTIVERPDSYSLADNLTNFVFRMGLSSSEVIYKTDNGKAMKSRLMTKEGFKDVEYKGFDLEERHLQALKLMGIGTAADKGLLQNLGMIEMHSQSRQPRTKLIERQFGIGGTMEWFKDRPEYTGRRYEEKPEKLEKLIKSGNIWTSEEMVDYVINKVDEYNNRTHQGIRKERKGRFAIPHLYDISLEYFQTSRKFLKAFKGIIPQNVNEVIRIFNDPVFAKDELGTKLYSPNWMRRIYELCGWMSRPIPAKETLAMLTMKAEERMVHPYGISINSLQYINYKLQPYIGQKVVCRYSPSNIIRIQEQSGKEKIFIKEIYVFCIKDNEEFVCTAEPHPATVSGVKATGYAKAFISVRNKNYKEVSKAQKITSEIAEGKENTSEVTTPVIALNSFRDMAAKEMDKDIKSKRQQEKVKKLVNNHLENKLSDIYGTTIKIEEG